MIQYQNTAQPFDSPHAAVFFCMRMLYRMYKIIRNILDCMFSILCYNLSIKGYRIIQCIFIDWRQCYEISEKIIVDGFMSLYAEWISACTC